MYPHTSSNAQYAPRYKSAPVSTFFPSSMLRQIELTDGEFGKISRLVYDQCGINLTDGKKELVKARLGKRIRSGQFNSFQSYYRYVLNDPSSQELIYLLDSISTNYTFFFREEKHFDDLRFEFLPEMISRKRSNGHKLRFWSAGCASGEEPFSIAMTFLETIENPLQWDCLILGTDLSTKALKTAETGIFSKKRIQSVPSELIRKYFMNGENDWQDYVKVKEEVKRYVQFERLNLMEPFQFQEVFDCIFCRNVMIYFDKKTQTDLIKRLYECLDRGGYLLIGHSESLAGIQHGFKYVRPGVYKKA